jgi:hypothetical protein
MIQKLFLGLVAVVVVGVVGLSLVKMPAPSTEVRRTIEPDKILKTALSIADQSQNTI